MRWARKGRETMKYMNLHRYAPRLMRPRFNLQLFAEGEGDGGDNGAGDDGKGEGSGEGKEDPFDTFLKDPKNQAEFDRRVAKAMETQKTKLAATHKTELEAAKSEAAKLAKMNAEQKQQYELEKLQKENEELKAAQARTELGREASVLLKDHKIDATQEILDFVVGKDAEATKANIDKFVGIIEKQLKAAEVERATGTTPKNYKQEGEPLSEIEKRIAKYK